MAQFYGSIKGQRGEASRLGNKSSGLSAVAATWNGAVEAYVFHRDGKDHYQVRLKPWHGKGESRTLAEGVFEEAA